jgi:hypothetical protein
VISGGGTATAGIGLNGGSTLLGASMSFHGLVAGFDTDAPGHLDLADIALGSSTPVNFTEAANNSSGALTATDGVNAANITLLGQYIASQFTPASASHGGTLIGDPSVTAANDSNPATLAAQHHA